MNYKDKITMKFNIAQLDRIIVALITNGFNKKFASNVSRLFAMFNPSLYKTDYEKELRVYLIKEITEIILNNNIEDKEGILAYLDTDGKYYNDSVELLNNLYDAEIPENELSLLDKTISNQIKYGVIVEQSDDLSDMLVNLKAENYDDLGDMMTQLESTIDTMNRNIKDARESLENAKKDMSLSNSAFVNYLGNLITKERNPASKVKTGIQYLNTMFNGRT